MGVVTRTRPPATPNFRARVERDYPDLNTTGQTEEMVAEMFREWMDTRDTRTDTGKLHCDLYRDMSVEARFAKKSTAGRGDTLPDPELEVSLDFLSIAISPESLKASRRQRVDPPSMRDVPMGKPRT